jgi:hypothetical protein
MIPYLNVPSKSKTHALIKLFTSKWMLPLHNLQPKNAAIPGGALAGKELVWVVLS